MPDLLAILNDPTSDLPPLAREALALTAMLLDRLEISVRDTERRIVLWCRKSDAARRLATIPGPSAARQGRRSG